MSDPLLNNARKVGAAPHHELLVADADDVLIVVPEQGFKDTAEASRLTVAALQQYAINLGRKCGLAIMANNLLAQEPESRRVYAESVTPDMFFGIAMVVSNPIPRIIGNLGLRMSTLRVPIVVVDSLEAAVAWLDKQRPV